MPRLEPLPLDAFRSVERELGLDPVDPPLNVMRTLAHNPALYDAWHRLAGTLFTRSIPPRERELVILRAAWRAQAPYPWAQHARLGHDAGLTDDEIRRVADGPGAREWSPEDALLLRAVDELVDDQRLSDATWTALARRFEPPDLLSLAMLAGHYVMLAGVLNSAGVQPESDDMPRLGEA